MHIIEELIRNGSPEVTLRTLEHTVRSLPQLRAKFTATDSKINLSGQVDFLAQLLEDFTSGLCRDLPLHAVADIAFTLDYMFRETDLIPDSLPDIGFADDAALCERVLGKHHLVLKNYAAERGLGWDKLLIE